MNDSIAAKPADGPADSAAAGTEPALTTTAKLTPREKKWIIYDVGNSAFVLLSTAVIPIYAKSLMPADGNIVSAWGYAQTIASLVIALLMPLLGSIADVQGMKIKFFLGFFGTGVVTCCAMALPLTWLPFLVVYILATIGLNGSLTFYDSMLIDTTPNERMDKVSSHGYGWGYIGSTVPFIVCIALIFGGPALPFGWTTTGCTRASFIITAVWWVAFTIPLISSYRQEHYRATRDQLGTAVRGTFRELGGTFRKIVRNKPLWMFMLAFFFYIDAVNTVISMSTSYGAELGIDSTQLVVALLVTQFVAFPCAILYGRMAGRFGCKAMIVAAVVAYMCIVFFAAFFLVSAGAVLDPGDPRRHVPGRHPSAEPLVLRQDHPQGPRQRVLRLLRHLRQDREHSGHVPRGHHHVDHRQRLPRRAFHRHPAGVGAHLPAPAEGPNASVISPINQQQERRSSDKTADPTARAAT